MGMVFGFKLHALTNLNGLFERWAFAAANHPDVTPESPSLASSRTNCGTGRATGSGRQSLYRHRRADTKAIKHDPKLQSEELVLRSRPYPSLANRSEFQHSGEVTNPSGGSAKDVSVAHPYPGPANPSLSPSLGPTLNAGKPQDRSLQPTPLGGAIQVTNGVIS